MKQLIIVRKDLINRYGYPKMMVQAAHASTRIITDKIAIGSQEVSGIGVCSFYAIDVTPEEYEWSKDTYKKIIVYVKSEEKLLKIYNDIKDRYPSVLIKDQALTVYPEPMYTCLGVMGSDDDVDTISKRYKLQLLK